MSWLPDALPQRVEIGGLLFVPLTPALVEADYAAVMRDVPLLRAWSGQDWPTDTFPIADNLAELEVHEREQLDGVALTYSVLIDDVVQGCIYVWPFADAFQDRPVTTPDNFVVHPADAVVRGWLHDRPVADFIASTMAWLTATPFTWARLWWETNSHCPEHLEACDHLGLSDSITVDGTDRTWVLRAAPNPEHKEAVAAFLEERQAVFRPSEPGT